MHRLAYLLPPLTLLALLWMTRDYERWWLYVGLLAVSEGLVALLFNGINKDREFLSGYAVRVYHLFPWTEQVTTVETYTDGKGHTQTRTRVSYIRHPDEWHMQLNTGRDIPVDSSYYGHVTDLWRNPVVPMEVTHVHCVSGGGGEECQWDGKADTAQTSTCVHRYKNYVQYSRSLFRGERISKSAAAKYGLMDYPKVVGLEQDCVCASPELDFPAGPQVQTAVQRLNAFMGASSQVHFFILLFPAEKGVGQALKQRDYWEGGNKNEFTTCLGVERQKDGSWNVVWSKPFSWMDSPTLETAAIDWFIRHPRLDIPSYAGWLEENIHLWKRKEFKDFKYLGRRMSSKQLFWYFLLVILICAGMVALVLYAIPVETPF